MTLTVDALIVGAGVAGSALAHALARAGWSVLAADKASFPRHKACGEFLSPEAVRILRALSLEAAVRDAEPAPIRTARLHAERGGTLEIPLPEPALGVSRHALDAALQQAAREAGATVRTGCLVAEIREQDGCFQAELGADKEPVRARTVIGAWGRTPQWPVLNTAGAPEKKASRGRVGVKAHWAAAVDAAARAAGTPAVDLYFFRGGYVGIADVGGGKLNVAALFAEPAHGSGPGKADLARIVARAAEKVPVLRQRLAGASLVPGTFAGAFPVIPRRSVRAWYGGLPLVGDAAAVIHPLCGDGIAMALRGAELCAPLADLHLRRIISREEWRRSYTAQLERSLAPALRWGDRLARWMDKPWAAASLLRTGTHFPGAAAHLFRLTRVR